MHTQKAWLGAFRTGGAFRIQSQGVQQTGLVGKLQLLSSSDPHSMMPAVGGERKAVGSVVKGTVTGQVKERGSDSLSGAPVLGPSGRSGSEKPGAGERPTRNNLLSTQAKLSAAHASS